MNQQDSNDMRADAQGNDQGNDQRGASRQSDGRINDENSGNEQGLRTSGPDALSGFVADDAAGDSSIGAANPDGSRQSGIQSNFAKASPESNVGPAGAPQTSHGNAGGAVHGGVLGKAEADADGQSGLGGLTDGGAPGTTNDLGAQDSTERAGDDKLSERLADGAESSGTPGDGPFRTS